MARTNLAIFRLKHLGPKPFEYITALFNLSVTTCQISAICKSSLIISIPKPGKDTSLGTSYRPISLLCPATRVLESLILPTINKYIQPAPNQHGFRPDHSTTSALLQLTTTAIAMGFNNHGRRILQARSLNYLVGSYECLLFTTCCSVSAFIICRGLCACTNLL